MVVPNGEDLSWISSAIEVIDAEWDTCSTELIVSFCLTWRTWRWPLHGLMLYFVLCCLISSLYSG